MEFAMRTGRQILKRGFTLVETVVTVGIIGALAAVVYPTVVKQFDSADPARVAEDMGNIRTGLEAFGVNVRPQLPHDLEDLINRPNTTSDLTSGDALYSNAETAAWNGPYLGLSVPSSILQYDTVTTTGFGARIINRLAAFDVDITNPVGGDSVASANVANADFVAIRIRSMSGAAFNAANLLIDGPSEDDAVLATAIARRRTEGRFRCPYLSSGVPAAHGDACPNAYYLAVPTR